MVAHENDPDTAAPPPGAGVDHLFDELSDDDDSVHAHARARTEDEEKKESVKLGTETVHLGRLQL